MNGMKILQELLVLLTTLVTLENTLASTVTIRTHQWILADTAADIDLTLSVISLSGSTRNVYCNFPCQRSDWCQRSDVDTATCDTLNGILKRVTVRNLGGGLSPNWGVDWVKVTDEGQDYTLQFDVWIDNGQSAERQVAAASCTTPNVPNGYIDGGTSHNSLGYVRCNTGHPGYYLTSSSNSSYRCYGGYRYPPSPSATCSACRSIANCETYIPCTGPTDSRCTKCRNDVAGMAYQPSSDGKLCTTAIHNDKCYRFSNNSLSHKEASIACANMKGKLVDIHDATEQQILLSYIQGADFSYWTAIKSRTPDLFHPDGSSFSVLSPWMSDYPYAPGDVCVLLDSSSGYRGEFHMCAEHQNYICESDIDLCDPIECLNGGNCIACFSDFSMCSCHPGYTGAFYEIDIDECSSSPCQNGGACVDGVNAFSCTCARGYTGVFCETDIDWCDPDPCPSGWMCVDGVPGFHCDAPMRAGTTSTFCSSFPCGPGWICAEKDQNGYSCTRE